MIQNNCTDCHTDDWKRTEPDHAAYRPRQIADTHGVGVGPRSVVWLAMYASLIEHKAGESSGIRTGSIFCWAR